MSFKCKCGATFSCVDTRTTSAARKQVHVRFYKCPACHLKMRTTELATTPYVLDASKRPISLRTTNEEESSSPAPCSSDVNRLRRG